MLKYTVRRLLYSVIILFFVMFLVYCLEYNLPGSYLEMKAQQLATKPGAAKSAEEWLQDLKGLYGMDQGVIRGYFTWLKNAVRGEWGESWAWTVPVIQEFNDTVWYSFIFNVICLLIEMFIAVPLGILAAKKQYGFLDNLSSVLAMLSISLPSFFLATLLKYVFSVKLGWFDLSGMQGRDYDTLSRMGQILDMAKHFVLPVITLGILSIGGVMRYTRTNMLEVLNSDYIRTARAKGVPERKVINKHAFRNTLIPLVTMFGGSLAGLFSGAMITEQLFAIRGIGNAAYVSMTQADVPFTMFYLSFISMLTLLGNLITDLLYGAVDPRVRLE